MAFSRFTTRYARALCAGALVTAAAFPAVAQDPPPAAPAATPSRLAWVDTRQIIQQTPGYAQAESTLTAEIAGFRVEVERLQAQLDSSMRAYDQQEIVLSPSNRQAKQQEIRQMQARLEQRVNELQTIAADRERELVAPIEERVKGVIEGLRAERNLSFIFDVGAPGNNVITADRRLDLTAVVIQRLNASQ
ncbi:MAG TPA: OmpH family outer membrane protein [Gemmatimonadales bacterium]